jgi:hypothetical protein
MKYKDYIKAIFIALCFLGLAFLLEYSVKVGSEQYATSNPKLWSFFIALIEEGLFITVFIYFRYVEKTDDYKTVILYKLSFILFENDIKGLQVRSFIFFLKNFSAHILVHFLSLATVYGLFSRSGVFEKIAALDKKFQVATELTLLAVIAVLPHWLFNWSVSYYTLQETKLIPIIYAIALGAIGILFLTYLLFAGKKETIEKDPELKPIA